MARVLFYTGCTLLAISAALLYLPTCFSVILAVLLGAALIVLLILRRKIRVHGLKTLLLLALVFTVTGLLLLECRVKPAEQLAGYRAELTGTVMEYPDYYDGYTAYEIRCDTVTLLDENGQAVSVQAPQTVRCRLTDVHSIDLAVFDRVRLDVTFRELDEYRASSLAKGIYAGGYVNGLSERLGKNRPFYAVFYDLRNSLNRLLYRNVHYEEATVISAVLLGDRSRLDAGFSENARVAGVSHVLVVSGMHLGIIFQVLSLFLAFLRVPRRMTSVLLMGSVFALAAVCGFTPSILRAGLTYFILALGQFLFRKPDSFNSLGAAAVIILFQNPFGFGSVSLLLSLFSTFGLLFLCPMLYQKLCGLIGRVYHMRRISRAAVFSLCQTVSATVFTMPVCILNFGYLSVIAPLTNLCIGYAVTLILVLALITLVLLAFPGILRAAAALPMIVLCMLVRYVTFVINRFSELNRAIVPARTEYLIPWILLMLALCAAALSPVAGNRAKLRRGLRGSVACLLAMAVSTFGILYSVLPQNRLAVLDVGKGSCVILRYHGDTVVIGAGDGAGDAASVRNSLLSLGERNIDCLILPYLDKSVAGGAPGLIADGRVDRVLYPSKGDYYDKLRYIADDRFTEFHREFRVGFPSGMTVTGADFGVVAQLGTNTVFIYTGGDFPDGFSEYDGQNRILVCIDSVPSNFSAADFSQVILSGSKEQVALMRRQLNEESAADCGEQTVSVALP